MSIQKPDKIKLCVVFYLILDKLYCLVGVHGKVSPLHHLAKVTVLVVVTKLILILVVRAEDHGGINQKWLVIYLI